MARKATQFSVEMKNDPGTLPRLARLLGDKQFNISGIMIEKYGQEMRVRFL